jgi:molybdopterin converting factor subunit 1
MINLKIVLFGIAKEIAGKQEFQYTATEGEDVASLLAKLKMQYPDLQKLASLAVAVNDEYAQPDQVLQAHDEVALIPPVSGG